MDFSVFIFQFVCNCFHIGNLNICPPLCLLYNNIKHSSTQSASSLPLVRVKHASNLLLVCFKSASILLLVCFQSASSHFFPSPFLFYGMLQDEDRSLFDRHIFQYSCREGNSNYCLIKELELNQMFFKKLLQSFFLQLFILQSNFQITLAFLLDTTKFLTQVDFYQTPRFLPADLHKFF